jgi:hypothetical protein
MKRLERSWKSLMNPRRVGQLVLIVAFLVVVYLPGLRMILDPPKSRPQEGWEENRPMPTLAWRLSSILSFPKDFTDYFRFNFGYRPNLLSMHTKLVGEALHESTSQLVIDGKDGWLFLGATVSIENYRGLSPLSQTELERWKQVLEIRHNWLAGLGIHYIFVVCPDKHTVYPEYMPDRINRVHPQTRLDQLVQYLKKERSSVDLLDLRPALMDMKKVHLCYQPQETHWNGVGAFAAYQQIAKRLRAWYPGLRVIDMSECEFYEERNTETDLLRLQGKGSVTTIVDGIRPVKGLEAEFTIDPGHRDDQTRRVAHSRLPGAPVERLLLVHDSFGRHLVHFLAEHARDGLYVWSTNDSLSPQDVLVYKPDVVIEEIVERQLCEREPAPLDLSTPPSSETAAPPPVEEPQHSQ